MEDRNLLLIVTDQWRGDIMPDERCRWLDLPNVKRLVEEGVSFRNHFSTAAPCGPARASLLTGMYAMNHRVVQNKVPMEQAITNLGEILRSKGRLAALVGFTSWMPDPATTTPLDQRYRGFGANMPGWTVFETTEEPDFERYFGYLRMLGYEVPDDPFDVLTAATNDISAPCRIDAKHTETAWATDAAIRFLHGRAGKPWVLHLGYWKPHPPFFAPAPFHNRFSGSSLALERPIAWQDYAAQHPFHDLTLSSTMAEDFVPGLSGRTALIDQGDITRIRQQYFGLMAELDHHIGRVLDFLKTTGQLEKTLIVFTSDHGDTLGDYYLFGKENVYDAAYHIPLVVRDPRPAARQHAGRVVEQFTESIDVMPTILDWLGYRPPTQCDGVSLVPFLDGKTPDNWRDAAHFEYDFRHLMSAAERRERGLSVHDCAVASIRDTRFKYVHFAAMPPMLFDMQSIEKESRNLAGDPAYQAIEKEYAQRLLTWRLRWANRRLTSFTGSPEGLKQHET
ncbi:sulfatase-like hydrolase/transferase [Bradyrhizobium valentinum]|uniref:sulfatase-like hydrolase/transferase n=1 Tax=Bradyrhizobium valentinum TaxID=1518501 RepID=UPI00070C2CB8|nr:sulfatase-like hydrolase/transferase [Bradyrhizobium valentinum]KRQ95428.1 hypothetical protein CQ10_32710 [Bradyrhizobium valentinum]